MENQVKSIGPQQESEDQLLTIQPEIETNLQELSQTECAQLQFLLAEYSGLFTQLYSDLGSTDVGTHSINTGDHPLIRQLPSLALNKWLTRCYTNHQRVPGLASPGHCVGGKERWHHLVLY